MRLHTPAVALFLLIAISAQGGISAESLTKFLFFKPNAGNSASRNNNAIKLAPLYNKFWNKLQAFLSKFAPKPIDASPDGIRTTTRRVPTPPNDVVRPPAIVPAPQVPIVRPPINIPGPLVPIPDIPGGSAGIGTGELEPIPEFPDYGSPPVVTSGPYIPIPVRPPRPQTPIPGLPGAVSPPEIVVTEPQTPIAVGSPGDVEIVSAPEAPIDVDSPGVVEIVNETEAPSAVESPGEVGIVTAPEAPIAIESPEGVVSTAGGKPPLFGAGPIAIAPIPVLPVRPPGITTAGPPITIAVRPPRPQIPTGGGNIVNVDESDDVLSFENQDPPVDYDAAVEARRPFF